MALCKRATLGTAPSGSDGKQNANNVHTVIRLFVLFFNDFQVQRGGWFSNLRKI